MTEQSVFQKSITKLISEMKNENIIPDNNNYQIKLISTFTDGFSGSKVYLVNCFFENNFPLDGRFVLKISEKKKWDNFKDGYNFINIYNKDSLIVSEHFCKCVWSKIVGEFHYVFWEVACMSRNKPVQLSNLLLSNRINNCLKKVSTIFSNFFNAQHNIRNMKIKDFCFSVLKEHRLNKKNNIFEFQKTHLLPDVTKKKFMWNNQELPNPHYFALHLKNELQRVFQVSCHGDLHSRNIFFTFDGTEIEQIKFIDFDCNENNNFAFYDIAYLEISEIINDSLGITKTENKERWLSFLKKVVLWNSNNTDYYYGDEGLINKIKSINTPTFELIKNDNGLFFDLNRQYLLQKVCAGLNWCNKDSLSECQLFFSFLYAAFHLDEFLRYSKLNNPTKSNFKLEFDTPHLSSMDLTGVSEIEEKPISINQTSSNPLSTKQLVDKQTILLKKIKVEYETDVPNYLNRRVIKATEKKSTLFSHINSNEIDILEVFQNNNRIVLLGDSGTGKSTELIRLYLKCSDSNCPYYPQFVQLNKFVNQNIEDFFQEDWRDIPQAELLVIFDGLDEIESINKNSAIRKIEEFSDNNPNSIIVISCRSNFYHFETNQNVSTLKKFTPYTLLPLKNIEIEIYLREKIKEKYDSFYEQIYRLNIYDLLTIPFYLTKISSFFCNAEKFPNNKIELYDEIFKARFKADQEHFRTTLYDNINVKDTPKILEKLAFCMELLEKNCITENEFESLITERSHRSLVKHCTMWKKTQGEEITWQFEHNNFQEYLAAKFLSKMQFKEYKEYICIDGKNKIKPSWRNTISFLLNMPNVNDLIDWIFENELDLIVKIEPEKITPSQRLTLFKDFFNRHKTKKIPVDKSKYNLKDIVYFAQSKDAVRFILNEIKNSNHISSLLNGIEFLSNFNSVYEYETETKQILKNLIVKQSDNKNLAYEALITLTDLKLNKNNIIDKILSEVDIYSNEWTRTGIYYLIINSQTVDKYLDILLSGIKFFRERYSPGEPSFLIDEQIYISKGLEKIASFDGIEKILKYFCSNKEDLFNISLNKTFSKIACNSATLYASCKKIYELILNFVSFLVKNGFYNEAKEMIKFFIKTNTLNKAFDDVLNLSVSKYQKYCLLSVLATKDHIKSFVDKFKKGEILIEDAQSFLNAILQNNKELYKDLQTELSKISCDHFPLARPRDFREERLNVAEKELSLLLSKDLFSKDCEKLFKLSDSEKINKKELFKLAANNSTHISKYIINFINRAFTNILVSFEEVEKRILTINWDSYSLPNVYNLSQDFPELDFSPEQKAHITKWCLLECKKIDFKSVLKPKKNGASASVTAILLWFFQRKLCIKYPKKIFLDLLLFDWLENNGYAGIEYLEKFLTKKDMKSQILKNIKSGIKIDVVLINHLNYCIKNQIYVPQKYIYRELKSIVKNVSVKNLCLEIALNFTKPLSKLEKLLEEVKGDFKWIILEKLVEHKSKNIEAILLGIMKTKSAKSKYSAAELLMKLQNPIGLKYFVNWTKKNKTFKYSFFKESPLNSINTIESLPLLIELLEISYNNDLDQDFINRLDSTILKVLSNIALQSNDNFSLIKTEIKILIDKEAKYSNLNYFLNRIEEINRQNQCKPIDIDSVIKIANNVLEK